MKLYIKNMVCDRCIMAVRQEAEKLDLTPVNVSLGEMLLKEDDIDEGVLQKLDNNLEAIGFERIDSKRSQLIERIKNTVIQQIHHSANQMTITWSQLLSDKLHYEYNYLSNLFSSTEGITLEQYIIRQKVEKIKELLMYDELTLNEIAWQLGYNSPAYLNSQFKKVTGMTPGQFKKLQKKDRSTLDRL